jgi:hypothetical protein
MKSEEPYVCQRRLSHIGNYISSLVIVGFTLISLTGCYFDKAYLPSENRVYKHVRKLAKRAPKRIIRKETDEGVLYHDPGLEIKDVNNIFSDFPELNGRGTILLVSKESDIVLAGYTDFDELNGKANPEKKTSLFIRVEIAITFPDPPYGIEVDMIGLFNGRAAVLYDNKEGWKKGLITFENFNGIDDISEICQMPVPDKEVDRYLKLAKRIRKTCLFESLKSDENSIVMERCINKNELQVKIADAKMEVDAFGEGHVISGRVVLDGPGNVRDVTAQMEILPEGYFAGPIKEINRTVCFRMHQYAPYDLQLKGKEEDVVNVGTIHMIPLNEDELLDFKVKVNLEGSNDSSQASILLSVMQGPVNTPSNGTSPRSRWPEPIRIPVLEDGTARASGFSSIEYWCSIKAPGYVDESFPVGFKRGQALDLGTITLEIPKQIELSYIVAKEPPFDLKNLHTVTITAGTKWKATEDIYGWDLEFKQEGDSIIIDYSYAPCFLKDLGKGEIADCVNVSKAEIGQDSPWNQQVNNEHVYVLHQAHWERWVLFKISIE